MLEFHEKQIMTEGGNRNWKFFQVVNKVVNVKEDEITVEKKGVEDFDKFNSVLLQ